VSNRKATDSRRFGFCIRCLAAAGPALLLKEHHIRGRKSNPASVVFICQPCHDASEIPHGGPIETESDLLERKCALLVSSRSLVSVLENRASIVAGFQSDNRDGPSIAITPGGFTLSGLLGAVGFSGRRYYLVPSGMIDQFVTDPSDRSWNADGIGGPAGDTGWVRFKGTAENVLNKFLDLHAQQGEPGGSIEALKQD
jgi:hypothetical protein